MAEQATFVPSVPETFEYEGDVQVVQGAYNHYIQLAPLDEGTPFKATAVKALLDFMFKCAEAADPEAKVSSVHAPDQGGLGSNTKGPFTVTQLKAFIKEHSPSAKLKKNRSTGKPYIGLYLSDSPSTGRRKNKTF
tara:strand:+ start:229 stop:633 length:405 start_codon:yes stop_codon:yes gene_type:complete